MNLTDLTPAAQAVVNTILCSECKGTGVDESTYVPATQLQPSEIERCGNCWDHPGIDPDVILPWCVSHNLPLHDGRSISADLYCILGVRHGLTCVAEEPPGHYVVVPLEDTNESL